MAIEQFDHAVLLVNDEPRARDFYRHYLDAKEKRVFTRPTNDREFRRSFLQFGPHGHVLGLFEDKTAVPPPRAERDWPAVVFCVSASRFQRLDTEFSGVPVKLPLPGAAPTLYVLDPEGNAIGFEPADDDTFGLLRLELDVPQLEAGSQFYGDVLGLGTPEEGIMPDGVPYAWFRVGDRGQAVLLMERDGAPGPNPAHHFAFLVEHSEHLRLKENLARLGVAEVPGRPGKRDDEEELGTYFMDPWGRRLQWISRAEAA